MCKRLSTLCVFVLALAFTGVARSDVPAEAKAVLDKAIKAMGDEAKLAKFQTGTAKGKITGGDNGQELTAAFEGSWRGPAHYRINVDVEIGGQNMKALLVIKGDDGWGKFNDKVDDVPAEILTLMKNGLHAIRMPQLLGSFKDPAYKLTLQGDVKVGDGAAMGVLVNHKDYQDVILCFDKESGLPVKSEVKLSGPGGKEITIEYLYSDYKEFAGVKQPSKVTIKADDKEFKMTLESVKAEEKLEDSVFEKP